MGISLEERSGLPPVPLRYTIETKGGTHWSPDITSGGIAYSKAFPQLQWRSTVAQLTQWSAQ